MTTIGRKIDFVENLIAESILYFFDIILNYIFIEISDFMSGKNFPPLDVIVSREKKFELLDKAIERHDGNAITRIIIWLKSTLKRDPDLMKDLMIRPAAMNHYICYLQKMKEFDELFEV